MSFLTITPCNENHCEGGCGPDGQRAGWGPDSALDSDTTLQSDWPQSPPLPLEGDLEVEPRDTRPGCLISLPFTSIPERKRSESRVLMHQL